MADESELEVLARERDRLAGLLEREHSHLSEAQALLAVFQRSRAVKLATALRRLQARVPRLRRESPAAVGAASLRAPSESEVEYFVKRDWIDNEHVRLLLSFALPTDANCLDVGAHEGLWLKEFLRVAPAGRHVAYEPIPELAQRLKRRFPSIDVRELALSNSEGESSFVYLPDLPAYSGLRERTYPDPVQRKVSLTIRTECLDDHWPAERSLDLVIIDVEGAEALVLEGALKTLVRYRPIVVFEHGVGAADHYGTQPRDVWTLLHDGAGLRVFDLDGNGPYSLSEFEAEFAAARRWNYVAHA